MNLHKIDNNTNNTVFTTSEENKEIEKKEEPQAQHLFWNIKKITITPTKWAVSLVKNPDLLHEFLVIQKMDKEGNSHFYRGYLPEVKISSFVSTENKFTSVAMFESFEPIKLQNLFWGARQITLKIDDEVGEKIIKIIQQDVINKVEAIIKKDSKTKKVFVSIGVSEENKNGFHNWAEFVLNRAERDLEEDKKFHIEKELFIGTGINPKKEGENEKNKKGDGCVVS
jgi:hypothetical protein